MEDERSVAYVGRSDEMGVYEDLHFFWEIQVHLRRKGCRKGMNRARKLDKSRGGL